MATKRFQGLSLIELPREVKAEVEKPFSEKLEKAISLIKLWNKASRKSYVSCSFGKDSMVVLYLARQINPEIPVVYVNTGVDHRETVLFKDEICRAWKLNLTELRPEITFFQVLNKVKERGGSVDDGSKDTNVCCYHLKEKPLFKFVRAQGFTHCFTGVTAMESRHRAWTACQKGMEYYTKKQLITKVHPILYWRPEEVNQFILDNKIPVTPVYEKYGLQRTGCMPCTCYRGWREQLSRVNPKLYKIIMERYFGQQLLDAQAPKEAS